MRGRCDEQKEMARRSGEGEGERERLGKTKNKSDNNHRRVKSTNG